MRGRASQTEFVAMMALLFATIALSIDSMLPALPVIAVCLSIWGAYELREFWLDRGQGVRA